MRYLSKGSNDRSPMCIEDENNITRLISPCWSYDQSQFCNTKL